MIKTIPADRYQRNRVRASSLNNNVYFIPKIKDLGHGAGQVVGRKILVESPFHELMEAALSRATAEGLSVTVRIKEPGAAKAAKRRKAAKS